MKKLQRVLLSLLLIIYTVWAKIKWSPRNPWGMAFLNLSYKKYRESTSYKLREEFVNEMKEKNPFLYEQNKDFIVETFINSGEIFLFMKKITLKEKLLAIIAPFSINGPFGVFSDGGES